MSINRSYQPWIICLSGALFFYYVFFQMAMFNSLSEDLLSAFNLHAAQLGNLAGAYFLADAIILIPAGLLLDRFSTRTLCLFVLACVTLSTFAFAYTDSLTIAMTAHAMAGIGNAFAFLGSLQLAARWLPKNRLAIGMGLIITIGMLGGLVAQTPFTLLIESIGWRNAVAVNACFGVIIWILMLVTLKDHPHTHSISVQRFKESTIKPLKQVLLNSQNWICGSYTMLMYLPIVILGELWGSLFLKQARGLPTTTATSIAGMIFLGMIVGSPVLGWLSDKIERRQLPMLITAILLLINLVMILYLPNLNISTLMLLFFSLGFFSCGQCIAYPTMTEINPPHLTSTALSIVAIILNLGSAIFQPIFGQLMNRHHTEQIVTSYTAHDYRTAMLSLLVVIAVAIILSLKIKETFCKIKASEPVELTAFSNEPEEATH